MSFMNELDQIYKQAKKEQRKMAQDKRKYNDTGYSPTRVCELYDSHPNLTLAELSEITGYTIPQLKRILMGGSK